MKDSSDKGESWYFIVVLRIDYVSNFGSIIMQMCLHVGFTMRLILDSLSFNVLKTLIPMFKVIFTTYTYTKITKVF